MPYSLISESVNRYSTGSAQTSIATNALGTNVAVGDLLYVAVGYFNAAARNFDITDNLGGTTYTEATGAALHDAGNDNAGLRHFYARAATAGSINITATVQGGLNVDFPGIYAAIWRPDFSMSATPLLGSVGAINASANGTDGATSGNYNVVPASAFALGFGFVTGSNIALAAGTGWTLRAIGWDYAEANEWSRAESRAITSSGNVAALWTLSALRRTQATLLVFEEGTGAVVRTSTDTVAVADSFIANVITPPPSNSVAGIIGHVTRNF